jgi:hypothetical protein
MESLNPYSSPSFADSIRPVKTDIPRYYFLRHFLCFVASYAICLVLFYSFFTGLYDTLASFTEQTSEWLITFAIGTLIWFGHAILAKLNATVLNAGPYLNAVVGAAGFVICVLASQLISDYGPNWVAGPWSWTSEYVRVPVYTIGSIITVVISAWVTRSRKNVG